MYVDVVTADEAGGRVYAGCMTAWEDVNAHYDKLYALTSVGAFCWSYCCTLGNHWAPMGDIVLDSDRHVYNMNPDGRVYALNSAGELIWSYGIGYYAQSGPAISSDGKVYLNDGAGRLWAIGPTPTITPTPTQTPTPTLLTLILRPNGVGSLTQLSHYPNGGANWDKVDDVVADDSETYIYATSETRYDSYSLEDHGIASGIINSVQLYYRGMTLSGGGLSASFTGRIKVDANYYADTDRGDVQWTTHSKTWTKNPATEEDWTWDDIDALEIGCNILAGDAEGQITQLYLVVNYIPTTPTP